jgi:hypothetical protein
MAVHAAGPRRPFHLTLVLAIVSVNNGASIGRARWAPDGNPMAVL